MSVLDRLAPNPDGKGVETLEWAQRRPTAFVREDTVRDRLVRHSDFLHPEWDVRKENRIGLKEALADLSLTLALCLPLAILVYKGIRHVAAICANLVFWAAGWTRHCAIIGLQSMRWGGGWTRHGVVMGGQRAIWAASWSRHWAVVSNDRVKWSAGWTKHWMYWTMGWMRHWVMWTARWGRHWTFWAAGWVRHWMLWAVRLGKYPIKSQPIIRPRLGNLSHYPPRPLVLPRHYRTLAPPSDPPKISIVSPSYNQANVFERTIESVISQDYPNLEYIVQDGGSTDGTVFLLERFNDKIHRWASEPDSGQTQAINRGFEHATGDILAYLNSDDLILPGALNYVARYFQRHPDVDAVYGHRILIDEDDREIGRWVLPRHDDDVLLWADYIPQETLFWRRSLWEKIGGQLDESFRFAMDWDLLLRFREAGANFVRLPRFLGAFRIHEAQKTSAAMADVGMHEMKRLRERSLGYVPDDAEVHLRVAPYLMRHMICHSLYRTRLRRY